MKVKLLATVVAVVVFVFGVIVFGSAQLKKSKDLPQSFVITYQIARSENGETPVIIGLGVKTIAADGQWKRIIVRRGDSEYPRQVAVSFLDNIASFGLEGDHLECTRSSDSDLERDKTARTADWIMKSPEYVGEDSILGQKVYTTHQKTSEGWVEQAFSPLTRSTPLLRREHSGNVEYTEQAVSTDFRDVSPNEIRPPNLPIRFDLAKRFETGMASNPENEASVKRLIEEREAVATKLRDQGRIQ